MPNVLIVTVTKIEAKTVLKLFQKATRSPWERRQIGRKIYYALGTIGADSLFMVQSEMGSAGPGAAILTVRKAIDAIAPAAVIMTGIAFGVNPSKQQLGEILVSRQIQCYELQKVKKTRRLIRGDRVTAPVNLLDKFRSGDNDWKGVPTHFGVILSGEKLIDDKVFRDRLVEFEPEAIGGEMEGAGLYAAATEAKVDWILVKGICDWADGNKDNRAQSMAAHNAVSFVIHVIAHVGLNATHETHQAKASAHSTQAHTTLAGRILLIDDDPYVCRDLEKRIEFELTGCEIKSTTDPGEAMMLVSTFSPDLILLDLEMPDNRGIPTVARGLSLLSEIKSSHNELPIVVLTAFDDTLLVINAMRLGASYYLVKSDTKISTALMRVVKNELISIQSASSNNKASQLLTYKLENSMSLLELCESKLSSLESSLVLEKDANRRLSLKKEILQLKKDIRLYEQEVDEFGGRLHGPDAKR